MFLFKTVFASDCRQFREIPFIQKGSNKNVFLFFISLFVISVGWLLEKNAFVTLKKALGNILESVGQNKYTERESYQSI